MLLVQRFLFTLLFSVSVLSSQSLHWSDTFTYAGTLPDALTTLGAPDWGVYDPNASTINITSGSLTYSGYTHSGVGNKVNIVAQIGEQAARLFTSQSEGTSVYVSFMVQVASAGSGDYFFHLDDDLASQGSTRGFIYAKAVSTNLEFGIQKNKDGGSTVLYTNNSYSFGQTYLLVMKFSLRSGIGNDSLKFWVNPDLSGPEPAVLTLYQYDGTTDPGNLGSLILAQVSANGPTLTLAGVRVSNSWAEAPLPVQLTNFAATSSRFGVDLQWSTATELNNYGFDIERRKISQMSADTRGSDSENDVISEWNTVGFVQGAGTSTSPRDYSYTDANVEPGRYAYRIKQIDMNGAFTYYSAAEVEVGIGPKELALEPNYPNPFNPSTNITFTVPVDGRAALKVYNMLGQEVATLFDEVAVAGRVYQKTFDASSLPTGVYVSRLEFRGQSVMRKMLFVK